MGIAWPVFRLSETFQFRNWNISTSETMPMGRVMMEAGTTLDFGSSDLEVEPRSPDWHDASSHAKGLRARWLECCRKT
jgi:hypothetical protein